jgi:sigma-B regulation protein RsbU (phosphoserine phosphatase)
LACAGHYPPLILRGAGRVEQARVDGVKSLLWDELGPVPVIEQAIHAGDRIVFFTDGILDREAPDGSMFESDRLIATLATAGEIGPDAIVNRVVSAVEAFAAGHEPSDDQTLVVAGLD